jgi:F-type H+-transporting ATPase subunit b|uniref:F0F1 ATP synthase subunit B n=1 Tax=Alloprevotella sp. TaxID=1872471 RepID=UPI0015B76A3D
MLSINLPSILTPDFGLLFWMLLAFLIVFFLMAKYGFPIITKMVEDRKNYIDESLQKAHEANERLAGIQQESERLLAEARAKQAEILAQAKATGDSIVSEARNKAQADGAKLLQEAKAQIAAEKENALRDIRQTVADLSIVIAEKVVRQKLANNDEQQALIEQMLNEACKG